MRRPISLLCSLVLLALLAAAPGAGPSARVAVRVRAAGTTVWVIYTVSTTAGADSLHVTVTATGQPSVARGYKLASKTDSVPFPRPAIAGQISGAVSAIQVRRGLASAPAAPTWSYTEPDQPPPQPSVTVKVTPAVWVLPPGGTAHFTATVTGS